MKWAAKQMNNFNITMGGKGAMKITESLLTLGRVMPYIGAGIVLFSLFYEAFKDSESQVMTKLEEISKQIADLHHKVDSLPEKIRRIVEWNEVARATDTIKAFLIDLNSQHFDRMEREVKKLQISVLTLRRLLTNTNTTFLNGVAQDVNFITQWPIKYYYHTLLVFSY